MRHYTGSVTDSGCKLWLGACDQDGYGVVRCEGGKYRRAHRVAFEMAKGPIPPGKFVCHSCDTPGCVAEDHLWPGSAADNHADMMRKGRHGHGVVIGESARRSKLKNHQVLAIHADQRLKKDIAKDYGVNPSVISRIKSGDAWKHVRAT